MFRFSFKSGVRAALVGLCGLVIAAMFWTVSPVAPVSADTGTNWTAQYWNNNTFTGNPTISRTEVAINFNWASGSPDPSLPASNFSAKWTLTWPFNGGLYQFRAGASGGIRAYIDGILIIDQLHTTSGFATYTAVANLAAGNHALEVDYEAQSGLTGALFDWQPYSPTGVPSATANGPTPIPATVVPQLQAEVRVEVANVRGDPSTNNPAITQVYFGDIFPVMGSNSDGTWYLVQLPSGQQGWMWRWTLAFFGGTTDSLPISNAPVTPSGQLANVQGVTTIPVVVRDGPTVHNAKKIGALQQGTTVKILALSRSQAWLLITVPGLQGWVFEPYINITVGDLGTLPIHN